MDDMRRLPCRRLSHLNVMTTSMDYEMNRSLPFYLRKPAEPMPPPIREPPSPMENPDAPVREPDPEEPEEI
jgi:hypothetical protein